MNESTTIAHDELTREEQLELALAESRAREAALAAAIAQRAVADATAALNATRERVGRAALARRPAPMSAARDEPTLDAGSNGAASA